jgi:hypothetical protein
MFLRRTEYPVTEIKFLPEFIDENGGGPGVRLRKRSLKKG